MYGMYHTRIYGIKMHMVQNSCTDLIDRSAISSTEQEMLGLL